MAERPYERLDAMEKQLWDATKTIAKKFNEMNKKNKEFRAWWSDTKNAFSVASRNFNNGRMSRDNFIVLVQNKIQQAIQKNVDLASGYFGLREEIERIKQHIQSFQREITDRSARLLIADIAVILSSSERNAHFVLETFPKITNTLREFESRILAESDPGKMINGIRAGYNVINDALEEAGVLAQKCMSDILVFHKIQFKIYRIQKG